MSETSNDSASDDRQPPEHEGEQAAPEHAKAGAKQTEGDDPATEAARKRRRIFLFGGFGVLVLLVAAGYGIYYLKTGRYIASTDDAYTQSDAIIISPQVAGAISQVFVTDNEEVTQGQVLALIDDRSYQAAVEQAQADVASTQAQVATVSAQIDMQQAQIAEAEADVAGAQSNLAFAGQNNDRYSKLSRIGVAAQQTAQQAQTTLTTQAAALVHNKAGLEGAQKQLEVLTTQRQAAQAALQRSNAELDTARINLGYTRIVAPVDGAVGDRTLRLGLYVQPGTKLMSLVPMKQGVYIVANFKETDLATMYRGQKASIAIDAFPAATLHGTVDSLAPGSGATFSLLPPENATGNFTKIVQRVPVKIVLDANDPILDRIRPGLSVEVDVDSRTTPPGERTTLVER